MKDALHSTVSTFNFNANNIRIVMRDGQPWFVAGDIAKALNFRDATNLIRMLDDDEMGTHNMSTPTQGNAVIIINESGLYHALIKSRKPEAKPFRKWVTGEVLPSIRKTGSYTAPATIKALPGKLSPNHQDIIKTMVRDRISTLPEERRAQAARTLWSALNKKFGTTGMKDGYKNISDSAFDECVSLLARVPLTGEVLPPEQTGIDQRTIAALDEYIKDYGLGVSIALAQLREMSRKIAMLELNLNAVKSMSTFVRRDLKTISSLNAQ